MTVPQLGKMQTRIMQILWDKGQATAREITDELNEESDVAHSTVQTLLRKMEDKKAVAHKKEDRTFVFYPLVQESKLTTSVTKDLLDRIFAGSPVGLISHLLKNEKISKQELNEIRRLIDEREKQK